MRSHKSQRVIQKLTQEVEELEQQKDQILKTKKIRNEGMSTEANDDFSDRSDVVNHPQRPDADV